jgi:demethylmenaquinone methyltransferase/2-methoxy-6-polyprenyl-1,4-benzoquinol methylase
LAIQRPESETRIAAMFDRIAPRYDFLNRLLSLRQDQRWRRHLLALVPFRPEGRLLDVATGTGDVLVAATSAHPEYGLLAGVDISRGMLDLARAKLPAETPSGAPITLAPMSAERLDFASGSFDAVTIAFGLRNVVRKDAALEELARVLAPGGSLLILEFFPPKTGFLSWAFQLYFRRVLPLIGGLVSDAAAYRYLPESVGGFYEASELSERLLGVGLVPDEPRRYLFGACRIARGRKPPL